jgi:hypothetical protein
LFYEKTRKVKRKLLLRLIIIHKAIVLSAYIAGEGANVG